mgnify:CR=1 FL=1
MAVSLLALVALLGGPGGVTAQARKPLSVSVGGAALEWRPVVRVHDLLQDRALRGALHSGLPLRLQLRVELWKNELFDDLLGAQEIQLALLYEPLDRVYLLDNGRAEQRFGSLAEAEEAINAALVFPLRPRGRDRYYYLASLRIETLSLSDLEELQRWLRGQVGPAVQGRASVGRAVESGLRRLLVRTIDLPTRSYDARTGTFRPR